jgi:hypothetical protein
LNLSSHKKISGDQEIKKIKRYKKFNELKNDLIKIKHNDSLGLPLLHHYNSLGLMDSSTLRYYLDYIKIKNFIQEKQIDNIIEIGRRAWRTSFDLKYVFKIKLYHLIDLEIPLKLQCKYLNRLAENKNIFILENKEHLSKVF